MSGAEDNSIRISVRDLRVSYGDREILHGINFEVQAAETLVILGGSGSGKSTLLRTLVGLEKPSGGEVIVCGKRLSTITGAEWTELRKQMGISFQGGALFGALTVGENVALPLHEHTPLEDSTIEIMVRLKLEQVGLAGFEDYLPSQLSGGMLKRAAVARRAFEQWIAGIIRRNIAKRGFPNPGITSEEVLFGDCLIVAGRKKAAAPK